MPTEPSDRVVHLARRLLHRTRLLTGFAEASTPVLSPLSPPSPVRSPLEGGAPLTLPEAPQIDDEWVRREDDWVRQIATLESRALRAEQAAAWLRARLRATRARPPQLAPPIDSAALADDLTRHLTRMRDHHPAAVYRTVARVLSTHGLTVALPSDDQERPVSPWTTAQREALTSVVLARAPEVADPAYIDRVATLLGHRPLTMAQLLYEAHLSSPMGRRRLRLAIEALAAVGALTLRADVYRLNPAWAPPSPTEAHPRGTLTGPGTVPRTAVTDTASSRTTNLSTAKRPRR